MTRRGSVLFVLLLACFWDGRSAPVAASTSIGVVNAMTISNASGVVQTNYPLQFGRPFLDGAIPSGDCPQVLINGVPATSQADIKNSYPDGSVEFAVVAVVIPTIPASGSLSLTFQPGACNNTPLTQAQMLAMYYDFDAQISLTPASGPAQTADARHMLTNGDYQLWTAGPVAQTIMLGDDSAARKYDLGLGDGYHPFRPRFYATFWPATGQVQVRYVGENGNTQELEDLNYNLALNTSNARAYTKSNVTHYALSTWTKVFWLGRTPQAMINIDHNLAYLESTRFIPNYDTSITVPASTIASDYSAWSSKPHDIYDGIWDGGEYLVTPMGDAGAHPEIGPVPTWDVLWLYSGDWRMRQMSLNLTDGSAAFPANLREGATGKRLSRTDPVGSSTGLGLPVSTAGRPKLLTYSTYDLINDAGQASDKVVVVGALNQSGPWQFDIAHVPPMWFVPYILTGDPWYVAENEMWQSWIALSSIYPRGPGNGDYGTISGGQLRALAWDLAWRAEAAFMAPDADPEKAYLTYMTNDALAQWEGASGIAGTPFDGTPIKAWQIALGSPGNSANPVQSGDPSYNAQPPLRNMSGLCNATQTGTSRCSGYISTWEGGTAPGTPGRYFIPNTVGNISEGFMEWYFRYAIGRVEELGFAAEPIQARAAPWLIGMINNSGYPCLIEQYENATEAYSPGGFFPNWAAMTATFEPYYLSTGCPSAFADDLGSEGYPLYALSGLSYETGEPGGAEAWSWIMANVYAPAVSQGLPSNPKWDLMPRTDTNTLPAQTTAIPPS